MAMGRVEYANGTAIVYDHIGRRRTTKSCDRLVGYGPDGFVIKRNGFYYAHNQDGVLVHQNVPERIFFESKQWEWHDSFLRVSVKV